jgi:lysophospholipase L1-like esterase
MCIVHLINASISGATLNNIDQCIDRAFSTLDNTNSMVNTVVMCLGTNDVSKWPVHFRGNIPQIPIKESVK